MFDGEGYFEWLWQRSGLGPNYTKLVTLLYTTEYVPTLVDDENRRADGNALLDIYCQENGYDFPPVEEFDHSGCSVLEMMIAFATRINLELIGDPEGTYTGLWLYRMLDNLRISQYDDKHWDGKKAALKVWIWLHKKSPFLLFPISKKVIDPRKISEWERVNIYLSEIYL